MRRIKSFLSLGIALAMVAIWNGDVAYSQTADGSTPANEGVCDPLIGGTPGLYGLCVAYCEAQDLDATPGTPSATNILETYNKRRRAGDPDMPCLRAPCPCWSEDDLDIALPTLSACRDLTGDGNANEDGVLIAGPPPSDLNAAIARILTTSATLDLCFFVVQQEGLPNSGVVNNLFITKEEGAICEASIREHAASLGVDCTVP